MLGLKYEEFIKVFYRYFILKRNILFYKNDTMIVLPEVYTDLYDIYYHFFRFDNELNVYKFYKTINSYEEVLMYCNTFRQIYHTCKRIENTKMRCIERLQSLDLLELRHLINTQNNKTKNNGVLK